MLDEGTIAREGGRGRVHRWRTGVIGRTGNNHPVVLIPQDILQSQYVVPSEVVILIEETDFGAGREAATLIHLGRIELGWSIGIAVSPTWFWPRGGRGSSMEVSLL